jgi:hypothetical protein
MMSSLRPLAWAGVLLWGYGLCAQEPIHEVQWSREQFGFPQLSAPTLIEVPAVASSGFSFPYYLYVPKDLSRTEPVRLLVSPNNTGQATDDFEVHRASAKRSVSAGNVRRLADRLHAPLLVPVFPRPGSQWKIYTHYLDRDSMLVKDGPLSRIDLQLHDPARAPDARRCRHHNPNTDTWSRHSGRIDPIARWM